MSATSAQQQRHSRGYTTDDEGSLGAAAGGNDDEPMVPLSVWRQPLKTLGYFAVWLGQQINALYGWVVSHSLVVITTLLAISAIAFIVANPGESNEQLRDDVVYHVLFVGYWILLGILSSVGLGSGLHTFILFLGPHIIRVTIRAGLCDSIDFSADLAGYFPYTRYTEDSFVCLSQDNDISIWDVVYKVTWPSVLWGFGTAIGELPPYAMSRAARLSGDKIKELTELDDESAVDPAQLSLLERAKLFVHAAVQRYGFWAILVAASIPNPLFDLAGITCGYALVPFTVFFGATAIGKGLIKTSIQSIFYAVVFSPKTLAKLQDSLPGVLGAGLAKLRGVMTGTMARGCWGREVLAQCRACCDDMFTGKHGSEARGQCADGCGEDHSAANWVAVLWNFFIAGMILYFLSSIITASANEIMIQYEQARRLGLASGGDNDDDNDGLDSDDTDAAETGRSPDRGRATRRGGGRASSMRASSGLTITETSVLEFVASGQHDPLQVVSPTAETEDVDVGSSRAARKRSTSSAEARGSTARGRAGSSSKEGRGRARERSSSKGRKKKAKRASSKPSTASSSAATKQARQPRATARKARRRTSPSPKRATTGRRAVAATPGSVARRSRRASSTPHVQATPTRMSTRASGRLTRSQARGFSVNVLEDGLE